MKKVVLGSLVLVLAAAAAAFSADDAGKKVFDAKCGSCHGKDGKGNAAMGKIFKVGPQALDLTALGGKSDADVAKVIAEGKNKMPAYGKTLSADEQKAVLSYVRGLAPAKAEAPKAEEVKKEAAPAAAAPAAPAVSEEAKKNFAAKCASCHGKDGKGNAGMTKAFKVEIAALDLVDDASLAKSDEELVKLTREGINKMPAYKGKLSDKEIAEIVAYIRSLKAGK